MGYRTLKADSAEAALHLLHRDASIALLFTDVILPGGVNGIELADQVSQSYPEIKILLTSGYTGDGSQNAEKIDYEMLEKPYTGAKLARRVNRVLMEV